LLCHRRLTILPTRSFLNQRAQRVFEARRAPSTRAESFAQTRLSARWSKPVVVENRPGSDGIIGITSFISANDDHTLLFAATGTFTIHPFVQDKVSYDVRELAPLARISTTVVAISVSPALRIGSFGELVAQARAQPGKLNSAAAAGLTEFVWFGFTKGAGLNVPLIPYRDIVPAATDLAENRIQVLVASYAVVAPLSQAGRIKVVAVANDRRAPMVPDIPTVGEAGFPGLEMEGLVGLFGPRSMPSELRDRIAADVRAVSTEPVLVSRLAETGQIVNPGTPAELTAGIEDQTAKIATAAKMRARK
jgi:tripartite-type tricarboxylate transporter receptor subunit TctC